MAETILLVDDNEATRYAVRRVLERGGFEVIQAATGEEGLQMLDRHDVSALVLDVNLPDISGFEVVRQLRLREPTRLLPVLHVSAASIQNRDLISGLEAGADAYLVHPVDHGVLLATLGALLRVRKAERALATSEARLRAIFANTAAPIAVLDANLGVHDANTAFQRLFRGAGFTSRPIDAHVRPGQEESLGRISAAIDAGREWTGALDLVNGRVVEVRVSSYRQPGLGLVFIEDVTDQRERERSQQARLDNEIAQREHSESQLLQLQKMDALGKLTGGIAHDFNNMLTSIMAGVDLISSAVEQGRLERVERFAGIITSSAQRAAGLTQRMLAFARQQPLDPQACDVNERIRSLEDMLARTIGEHIDLRLALADGPMTALTDVNQLENVIVNLVINARDAVPSEGGRIVLSTARHRARGEADLDDGDYVAVRVDDNGSGIPPELMQKVFEPFFTTKSIGKGTGLGLSMTYGFARQSGGTVRLHSEAGVGTRVDVLLPAGTGAVPAGDGERATVPAVAQAQGRILVVDDNELVRQTVADILGSAGYTVVEAAEATAALEVLARQDAFDLLLTDVGLPGMSGRAMADLVRAQHPRLPIVFMTGYTTEAVTRSSLLGEGMSLLPKPFSMRELLDRVRATLE